MLLSPAPGQWSRKSRRVVAHTKTTRRQIRCGIAKQELRQQEGTSVQVESCERRHVSCVSRFSVSSLHAGDRKATEQCEPSGIDLTNQLKGRCGWESARTVGGLAG